MLFAATLFVIAAGCARRTVAETNTSNRKKQDTGGSAVIRVLSYNIHHANPPSRADLIDMKAIANVILSERPDLVALQEADVYTSRSGSSLHQAEELGRLTGMKAYFAKAIDYAGGDDCACNTVQTSNGIHEKSSSSDGCSHWG